MRWYPGHATPLPGNLLGASPDRSYDRWMAGDPTNLTGLLIRAADGDSSAHDDLFENIYPVLRKLAHRQLSSQYNATRYRNSSSHLRKP